MEIANNILDHSISEYRKAITSLSSSKSTLIFDNKGADHAAAVSGAIFRNAKSIVRIFANNMNGEISNKDDYYQAMCNYLYSGKYLYVIVDRDEHVGLNNQALSRSIAFIRNNPQFKERVKFKAADDEFREIVKNRFNNDGNLCYFTLGDNSMFRIEMNNADHLAKCSFNNESIADLLVTMFMEAFERLPDIEIYPKSK